MQRSRTLISKFFKDKDGKVVIWQTPNVPLVGWVLFTVSSYILKTDSWRHFASYMSFGFIFIWAWLEISQGRSNFRRTLGVVVLLATIYSRLS